MRPRTAGRLRSQQDYRTARAREFHEECLELAPRQRLHYSFRCAQPLEFKFNIYYHRGNEVVYPVRLKNVRASKNIFSQCHNDSYCLMWINAAGNSVKLEYQFSVQPATAKK